MRRQHAYSCAMVLQTWRANAQGVQNRGRVQRYRRTPPVQDEQRFIDQQITEWVPPSRLTFVANSDTIGMYKHVKTMRDTFLLERVGDSVTRLTRLTDFETKGSFASIKAWLFGMTVRRLHRYVTEGFRILAEERVQ